MIEDKIKKNNINVKIFDISDVNDLIEGKKCVEKILLEKKIIDDETTIPHFLTQVINISKYIYINNILEKTSESIAFDGLYLDGTCYLFITEKNGAWASLKNYLSNINYNLYNTRPYKYDGKYASYILRINNSNYLFNDDLNNENL